MIKTNCGKGKGITGCCSNKVEICGVNTAKLPVLSNSKMRELILATKWNASAREKLVNERLALS